MSEEIELLAINRVINPFFSARSPRQSVPAGSVGASEQQRGKVHSRGAFDSGGSQVGSRNSISGWSLMLCLISSSIRRQGQMCCRCLRLVDPTKIGESPLMENGSDLDDDDLSLYELLNSIGHQPKSYRNEVTVQVRDLLSISCFCLIIIELLFKS